MFLKFFYMLVCPLILCLDVSLRSLKDAPISDFADAIFPHCVGEKDITAI